MLGQLFEEFHAGTRVHLIAPLEGAKAEHGFMGSDALLEAGGQMRELFQGIEFAGENASRIALEDFRDSNDDCIGCQVSKALCVAVQQAGEASDEVQQRQGIDEAHQIAEDNLMELELEALRIDHAEFHHLLANRLAVPKPLKRHGIAQLNDEEQ